MDSARQRPSLVPARQVETLEMVRDITGGGFDLDAWHVMEQILSATRLVKSRPS